MFQKYLRWEKKISDNIDKNRTKVLTQFLNVYTELGSSLGAVLMFLTVLVFSGLKPIFIFVPVYIAQVLIVESIKIVLKRPRPENGKSIKRIFGRFTQSTSFPSGHASNIFTIVVLFSRYYHTSTEITIVLFGVALSVALTRLYLCKHYLIDIIGGAAIGLIVSSLAWMVLAI